VTHAEFIAAYNRGEIKVEVDPKGAARFVSAHLLLPFVAMPVAGAGIALALIGWIFTGLALIAVAFIVPRIIKRSAPHFVFQQAMRDPSVYDEATRAGVLRIAPLTGSTEASPPSLS
jgi:hypothetical protein